MQTLDALSYTYTKTNSEKSAENILKQMNKHTQN